MKDQYRFENLGGEMTRGQAMTAGPRVGVLLEARDIRLGIGLTGDRETGVGTGHRTRRVLPLAANPAGPSVGSRGVEPIQAGSRPVRHVRSAMSWAKMTHMAFA